MKDSFVLGRDVFLMIYAAICCQDLFTLMMPNIFKQVIIGRRKECTNKWTNTEANGLAATG